MMNKSMGTRGHLSSVRWARLMPLAFITYTFAYLDRSNYSIGAAAGLAHDLGITAGSAALLGALFFLGYFLFQIPAAHYAETRSVKRILFWSLLGWGVFAAAQGVIPWLWLLMVDRFLLGVVEAVVLPCMIIFLAHWFTSRERGRADTFLILGNPVTLVWMSAVSGYLVQAVGWRWMFIIEGAPAILWAFIFYRVAGDHPNDVSWLSQEEKRAIGDELAAEQRSLPEVSGYWQAFRRPAVVVLAVQYLLWSIGVYGLVFWLPTILKSGSALRIGSVGLLSAVPYALAAILMLANSLLSDRSSLRIAFVWPFLLVAAVAFYVSFLVGAGNFWVSFALLVVAGGAMYAPYGPYFALIPELLPRNVAGVSVALINSAGALGGFVGTYIVGLLVGSTRNNGSAFIFMAACLVAAAILMFLVRLPRPASRHAVAIGSSESARQ